MAEYEEAKKELKKFAKLIEANPNLIRKGVERIFTRTAIELVIRDQRISRKKEEP